jgi:SAM-dependent methyltransferase
MKAKEAAELLRPAVAGRSGVWADLGSGTGTFTRALVKLLAPGSHVYAVDRDESAIARLKAPAVTAMAADFAVDFPLPEQLDGMLFANSLHFVEDAGTVLERLARQLRHGGRVVIIEYDGRRPSRWVPYPLLSVQWPEMAEAAKLRDAVIRGRRRSAFGGDLYVASADRA